MYKNYENFLKEFDDVIGEIFKNQKKYTNCKKRCSMCCEKGNYPMSQIEFWYLTQGFLNLPQEKKHIVQQNIKEQLNEKKENKIYEHQCPFLIDKECSVYKNRAIICRTFGICYYDDNKGYVKLPECVNYGLNYSKHYDKKTKELKIKNIPKINLSLERILTSELAKRYKIENQEIRPLLDWLTKY